MSGNTYCISLHSEGSAILLLSIAFILIEAQAKIQQLNLSGGSPVQASEDILNNTGTLEVLNGRLLCQLWNMLLKETNCAINESAGIIVREKSVLLFQTEICIGNMPLKVRFFS